MPLNPHANFSPVLEGYTGQDKFRFWCQMALPLTYDDSLSYYELLCKVVTYLNNTIEDVSDVETNVTNLATAYDQLQSYVNNYFDNLDIEAELRNVLDAMAEDGTLDDLLDPLVQDHLPSVVDEQIDDVVADQIDDAVAGQIDDVVAEQLPPLVEEGIPGEVSDWLTENVDPVGSAVVVDSSLTISGAAADAKVTGDELADLKTQTTNIKESNPDYVIIAENFEIGSVGVYNSALLYTNTQQVIRVKNGVTVKLNSGDIIYTKNNIESRVIAISSGNVASYAKDFNVTEYTIKENGDYTFAFRFSDQRNLSEDDIKTLFESVVVLRHDSFNRIIMESITNKGESGIKEIGNFVGYKYNNNLLINTFLYKKSRVNINTGNIEYGSSLYTYVTDFIPIESGQVYTQNFMYLSGASYGNAYYDESKQFISGFKAGTATIANVPYSYTTPATAKYLRITIPGDIVPIYGAKLYKGNDDGGCYYCPYNGTDYTEERIEDDGDIVESDVHMALRINTNKVKKIKATTTRQSGVGGWTIAFYSSNTPSSSTFIVGYDALTYIMVTAESIYDVPYNAVMCVIVSRRSPAIIELGYELKDIINIINKNTLLPNGEYNYYGGKINLSNTYGIKEIGRDIIKSWVTSSASETEVNLSGQGMAIYGYEMFRFHDKGYCRVYNISDLANITFVRDFDIDGYGSGMHCNCATFGKTLATDSNYPLLYLTKFTEMTCFVEKLTNSGSEIVQTITLDQSVTSRHHGDFWLGDDDYLYVFVAPASNDADIGTPSDFVFYKFAKPDVSISNVVLTENDIIDTWKMKDYVYSSMPFQGAITHNGKIYVAFGTSQTERLIKVWDAYSHELYAIIPLTTSEPHEPEDMSVYKGQMIVAVNGADVAYTMMF